MLFNVNDYVKVRLTERGRELLRMQVDELNAMVRKVKPDAPLLPYEVEEDAEGWSRWQLWDLMQRLGPHIKLASEPPFETDIQIEAELTQ